MKKSTLITVGLALFFILAASGILLFFFQGLKRTEVNYTVIEDSRSAPSDTGVSDTRTSEEGGAPGIILTEDTVFAKELYMRQMNDNIREEFVVDDHTFYRVDYGSSLEPTEKYLSQEEAAHLALLALQDYFPEQDWDCSFFLHPVSGEIVYLQHPHLDPVYNGTTSEGGETPFISLSDFTTLTNPLT